METLGTLFIGALAGWLGSTLYKGKGMGLIGNIVIGLVGSSVGRWLLAKFDLSFGGGFLGAVLTGAIGAIVVLALFNFLRKQLK